MLKCYYDGYYTASGPTDFCNLLTEKSEDMPPDAFFKQLSSIAAPAPLQSLLSEKTAGC